MSIIGHAIAIAAEVHKDQVDKGGEPYIYHCLEVMKRSGERYRTLSAALYSERDFEIVQCVGVLHDAIEDTEDPLKRLQLRNKIGSDFPMEVLVEVERLTKQDDDVYALYIERVALSWLARIVKLCDLSHNLEAWRIPSGKITERDYKRWDKYHRAFVRLMRED